MTNESESLLSDLMDGPDVDPDRLAVALAEPGAAETLVAFARVKRQFGQCDERPSAAFYASMQPVLSESHRPEARPRPRLLLAVAALLLLATVIGGVLGRRTAPATERFASAAYCMDRYGSAHQSGQTAFVDGLTQECVTRGTWIPVIR
jgi:hypothetical protein